MNVSLRAALLAAWLLGLLGCDSASDRDDDALGSDASTLPDGEKDASDDGDPGERFSFFVASFESMQLLSGNAEGFGGDLRFGETGPGAGLRGADKICTAIAEIGMAGASKKTWRAFLSVTADENGQQVDAIDRIGEGPWYDRLGRVLALDKAALMHERPEGADPAIANDFPNEFGVPNQTPDPNVGPVDNHDILTGTNTEGRLYSQTATCMDWTSAIGDPETEGRPRVGHSWDRVGGVGGPNGGFPGGPSMMMFGDGGLPPPRFRDGGVPVGMQRIGPDGSMGPPRGGCFTIRVEPGSEPMFGEVDEDGGALECSEGPQPSWMSILDEAGCKAGSNLVQTGPPDFDVPTVGSGGGYGGIYCFALTP